MTGFIMRRLERKIEAWQRELTDTHLREVESMYTQMRSWRHDTRNHIQTMKALAQEGDLPEIRRYLDQLEAELHTIEPAVRTGNSMADAILNSKISLAKTKGITVIADAHIPVALKTSAPDLCCVLGNLFDNAMEACLPLPEEERVIRIYMEMKQTQLYISFTNMAAGGKLKKEGGLFRSTKGKGRGLGLMRIDKVIGRLGGYLRRESEEGAFTTEILIPQE